MGTNDKQIDVIGKMLRRTVYGRIFGALEKLIPVKPEELRVGDYFRFTTPEDVFMPLSIEVIEKREHSVVLAMAHRYEQNGDLIPDPEMTISYATDGKPLAEALTFQTGAFRIREVYPKPGFVNPREKKEQNAFLQMWLRNVKMQGHKLTTTKRAAED